MTTWTAADLPDLTERTAIVTGANSGIGRVAARELARAGAHVILAVRSTDKGEAAAASMPGEVDVRRLDLADLASVRDFADGVKGDVDLLINNAGVMAVPESRTADGFEMQIGTNHLGHFALTNLLLTAELQRRLEAAGSPVIATAAHPGWSATHLQQHTGSRLQDALMQIGNWVVAQSDEMGALPTLYAATADIPGNSYAGPSGFQEMRGTPKLVDRTDRAKDAEVARKLWDLSEKLTGITFPLPTTSHAR